MRDGDLLLLKLGRLKSFQCWKDKLTVRQVISSLLIRTCDVDYCQRDYLDWLDWLKCNRN